MKNQIEKSGAEFDKKWLLTDADYKLMEQRGVLGGKEQIKKIKDWHTQQQNALVETIKKWAEKKKQETTAGWIAIDFKDLNQFLDSLIHLSK